MCPESHHDSTNLPHINPFIPINLSIPSLVSQFGPFTSSMGTGKNAWGLLSPNGWGPGATPRQGVERGQAPRPKTNLGHLETSLLPLSAQKLWKPVFPPLEVEDQNQHFITFSSTPMFKTTNIKADSQDHKIYSFPLEHFKIYVSMSHDLPHYQSWDDSSSTKSYEQFINYEKASWKCCACKFCKSIVSKQDLTCVQL